jgi:tetratricopeptide (TPR) repeat protein
VSDFAGDEDRSAAADDYLRLLAREPNSLRFAEYADRLRQLERLSDAMVVCKHGLVRHPSYATGHVVMAEILLDAGTPEMAAHHLREALQLDPSHPRAHLLLGELLLTQGDKERAAAEFEAALLASPNLVEAQAGLAEARGVAKSASPPAAPGKAASVRAAGQRPEWLTVDRIGDLLDLVAAHPSVDRAHVVDADGRVLASSTFGGPRRSGEADVGFVNDLRGLASRLAAGRLQSLALCGRQTLTLYLPLGDLVLVAGLRPGADLDEEVSDLGDAISAGPRAEMVRAANG